MAALYILNFTFIEIILRTSHYDAHTHTSFLASCRYMVTKQQVPVTTIKTPKRLNSSIGCTMKVLISTSR